MHKLTIPFLIAISDMLDKVEEMIPKLADHLNASLQELPYLGWNLKFPVNDGESYGIYGTVKNTNWKFGFLGSRCWFWHTKDKRELIVTFGPKGRIDTFSQWEVIEYIGQSKPPWPEYKELKKFLFLQDNGYEKIPNWEDRNILIRNEFKINKFDYIKKLRHLYEKTSFLMDELEANELIAHPDPELCEFVEKHTKKTTDDEGHTRIELPEGRTKNERIDIMVCNLWIISEKGKDQIKRHRT